MNRSLVVMATLTTFSFLVACGDGSSSNDPIASPDFDRAAARFDGEPTGSLTKENGGSVASSTRTNTTQGKAGLGAQPLGGGSSTGTRSLRILSSALRPLAETNEKVCADIEANKDVGSCACDSGTMRYDIPNLKAFKESESMPAEAQVKLQFETCKIGSKTFNGLLAMKFS